MIQALYLGHMQQERDSLVLISKDEKFVGRCKQANEFLLLETFHYKSLDEYLKDDKNRPRTVVWDCELTESEAEQGLAKIRQFLPRTQVLQVVLNSDSFSSRAKADWIVSKDDMMKSYLPELFLFQKGLCEFYEIAPTDLFPDTMVYFNAYHYLPLNRRYFPLVHENFSLSERKHKKIENLKTLYIDRKDTTPYIQYIEKYFDQYKVGLKKRTRAWTYQLITGWRNFMMKRLYGFENPMDLATDCPDYPIWINEVLNYWRSANDPWSLVFEAAQLSYFKFESSCLETVIACFLSRFLGDDEAEKIINIKAEMSAYRQTVDPMLVKKWLATYGTEIPDEDRKKWGEYFALISQHPKFHKIDSTVAKEIQTYGAEFIAKEKSELKNKTLIHIYWGEVITSVFQKSRGDEFKKQDLLEEVIVRCKADGILNEAWIEELRRFLLKGPTQ